MPKYYGNFEYDDGKLYFIIDRQRISLSNEKEEGQVLALSTIQGGTNVKIIRSSLGVTEYATMSKVARAALQAPARNLDEISVETIPLQDLPKAATDVERDVEEIASILGQDEASNFDGLPMRELFGLNKALQTIQGNLDLSLAGLNELDEKIEQNMTKYAPLDW